MNGLPINSDMRMLLEHRAMTENSSVEDILKRLLNTEEHLQLSEANLCAVLEGAWHSFALINPQYRVMKVSIEGKRSMELLFGTPMRAGDSILDFIPPVEMDSFKRNFAFALSGQSVMIEKLLKTFEGKDIYFEVSHHPIITANGKIMGVCLSYQNITKRKRIQRDLSQSESRLQSLLETQSAFVIRSSLDGRYTYANPSFAKRYEWFVDSLIGLSLLVTVHPDDHEKVRATALACLNEPCVPIQLVIRKISPDSTTFWTLWEFVSIVDSNNVPTEIQCIGFDISEQVKMEEGRLEQERLWASLKKEQEFNALVQKVVFALAHDVRIPLAVINSAKNMLDRYFDRLDDASRHEKLDTIGKQVRYVIEMLDDVTMSIRGNLDHQPLKPTLINLSKLCQICIDEIQQTSGIKHRMNFVTDQQIQYVLVDETLINRILLNLLSNAVKFSPDSSEIRLELSRDDDKILLRVVDHGMGISEADQQHLFEPFYRTQSAQYIHGTGLGLNIVKECVERHQGAIHVQSTVGEGTTFTVELPFHTENPA